MAISVTGMSRIDALCEIKKWKGFLKMRWEMVGTGDKSDKNFVHLFRTEQILRKMVNEFCDLPTVNN
jgi:hypothetical protein